MKSILEPNDRISEVLFGLIMVLTFTGSLSVVEAGHEDVRAMLVGALGCNIAWGVIDGILYLMGCLAERGRNAALYRAVRESVDVQPVRDGLPPIVASILEPAELESIQQRLKNLPDAPARARVTAEDLKGAVAVFLWVFVTTFPVTVPFMVMNDAHRAMRLSNTIAVVMLFIAGYAFGRITGARPWIWGVSMVLLGCVLVVMTIALGG